MSGELLSALVAEEHASIEAEKRQRRCDLASRIFERQLHHRGPTLFGTIDELQGIAEASLVASDVFWGAAEDWETS